MQEESGRGSGRVRLLVRSKFRRVGSGRVQEKWPVENSALRYILTPIQTFADHLESCKYLVDDGSWDVVEEYEEEHDEEGEEEELQDQPFVSLPDDVSERLQRVHEPHERGVRSTEMIELNMLAPWVEYWEWSYAHLSQKWDVRNFENGKKTQV